MRHRRLLSLWFPRLGAERVLRRRADPLERPFATVAGHRGAQLLDSVSAPAEALGLRIGQGLRDALAACPDLVTEARDPAAEEAFLSALGRWAEKFSPWIAEEPPDTLVLDVTGCTRLFGGEAALARQVTQEAADLGLSLGAGLADTPGAAWALAHHGADGGAAVLSGDAIDQEARATRSRAARRPPPGRGPAGAPWMRIAPPGGTREAVSGLPVAALRIDPATAAELSRLGLRRIGDLLDQPRAGLARRFGRPLVERLDQVTGMAPEPIRPIRRPERFAARMSLPDPIGLESDVMAAIDRLLAPFCARLRGAGQGVRRVRLELYRTDRSVLRSDVELARPGQDPGTLRPLVEMKVAGLDAGYGIDAVRIEALATEPVVPRQVAAPGGGAEAEPVADLIARLGARIGMDRITRQHPADSHIPEKGARILAAAWSDPARDWPAPPTPRPMMIWPPEPVAAHPEPAPPGRFRWRGRDLILAHAQGPERIAPEWWLDDPAWRTGTRDYWRVTCDSGDLLWLYYAHGGTLPAGWFCQGAFC